MGRYPQKIAMLGHMDLRRTRWLAAVTEPRLPSPLCRAGVSLIEAPFVIPISVAILAGVLALSWATLQTSALNTEVDRIINLATATRRVKFNNSYDPLCCLFDRMVAMRLTPIGLTILTDGSGRATGFEHGLGGTGELRGHNGYFSIVYHNLSDKDCVALATAVKSGILQHITIAGHTLLITALHPETAASLCASGTNTLTWSSRN